MSTQPQFDLPEEPSTGVPPVEPAAAANEAPAQFGSRRFKTGDRRQIEFRELSLDDLVPLSHPVRAVDAWVEAQDLSGLISRYRAVEGGPGRDPIHPRLLLRLWLYATLEKVGSARELSRLIERDSIYEWLAGGLSICHRVLSEFRVLDGEFLEKLLVAGVADLMHVGLVSLDCVAQDGMRVRAHAGKSSFHRRQTLEQLEEQARERLQTLRKELEQPLSSHTAREHARQTRITEDRLERLKLAREERDKLEAQKRKRGDKDSDQARASTTDPEARTMKMANGGFNPAFNVQFVTDVDSGIIVSTDVTNRGTDAGHAPTAMRKIHRQFSKVPHIGLFDGGYSTRDDIDELSALGVTMYSPIKECEKQLAKGQDPYAPHKGDSEAMIDWRKRMKTDEAKEKYKLRCQTAEWVNAQTRNHGFQQFLVRGLKKAKCIALWHALAHNVQRGVALRATKENPGK